MNCESIWYLFGIYLVNIITIDQSSILSNVPSSTIGDWIIVIIGYIGEFDRIMPCNHLPDGLLSTAHLPYLSATPVLAQHLENVGVADLLARRAHLTRERREITIRSPRREAWPWPGNHEPWLNMNRPWPG